MNGFWVNKKTGLLYEDGNPVKQVIAADMGGEITPQLLVMHYTASGSAEGSIKHLTLKDAVYVSAHLCIDANGSVTQMVPFNRKAYHAGVSNYMGRTNCNDFSIGIEMVNWGFCGAEGAPRTWTGQQLEVTRCMQSKHKNGGPLGWWEKYTGVQVQVCTEVAAALHVAYNLSDIVGHDDISPGRKQDPGPAFPTAEFYASVLAAVETSKAPVEAPTFESGVLATLAEFETRLKRLENA